MAPRQPRAGLTLSVCAAAVAACVAAASAVGGAAPAQDRERRTVWSGIYTAEQAARGKAGFATHCSVCHGANLTGGEGPSLVHGEIERDWGGLTVRDLFEYVRVAMPEEAAASVSDAEKLDILAFVFEQNGFPAGASPLILDRERLGQIMIESRDGPAPPPVGAIVVAVGCVAGDGGRGWILRDATEPVRTTLSPAAEVPPPAPPGTHTLQLIGATGIEAYANQRAAIVGLMIRSAAGDAINVLQTKPVPGTCAPG